MKAFYGDKTVEVRLTGDREILRDGQPCSYRDLPYYEQNYYDRVADAVYDLPIFEDGYVSARYNKFLARVPAEIEKN